MTDRTRWTWMRLWWWMWMRMRTRQQRTTSCYGCSGVCWCDEAEEAEQSRAGSQPASRLQWTRLSPPVSPEFPSGGSGPRWAGLDACAGWDRLERLQRAQRTDNRSHCTSARFGHVCDPTQCLSQRGSSVLPITQSCICTFRFVVGHVPQTAKQREAHRTVTGREKLKGCCGHTGSYSSM